MSDNNQQSVGEAIREFLRKNNLEERLQETEIYQRWEELVGKAINAQTRKIHFQEGTLRVYLQSAPLRQELSLKKEIFREQLNIRLKGRPVQKIEIL